MLLKENIPISYVFGKIKKEILILTLYSAAVYFVHSYYNFTGIKVPLAVLSVLGTVISLLLAFRSNQAYDRWWEARILWGKIVNDSRSFARQVLSFVDNSYDDADKMAMKERMIRRQMAWCHTLSRHLRKQTTIESAVNFVSKEEMVGLKKVDHVPLALMENHANDLRLLLRLGWVNEYQQVKMDEMLTRLTDSMGGCERIKNTVFPTTYSVYIRFLVLLFVILLPFGLIEFFGIFQIPLVVAISSSFFLIEKMAIHLQDPFESQPTDTPTTTISRKIERDLKQLLKDDYPKAETENTFVKHEGGVFYIL
jgi:putative membrane protein